MTRTRSRYFAHVLRSCFDKMSKIKAVYSIRAALKVKRAMVPSNVVVISLVSFTKILPLYHSTLHFRSDCFKLTNNSKDLFSITFTSVSSDISFVLIVILDDLLTTSSPLYHVTFGSGLALQRHFMAPLQCVPSEDARSQALLLLASAPLLQYQQPLLLFLYFLVTHGTSRDEKRMVFLKEKALTTIKRKRLVTGNNTQYLRVEFHVLTNAI
uniref:Uncharacterized protein n=1 Tax=Glossina austeni TaxID=7395 RepID=A0A1A9V0P3_GLOAU